MKPGDYILGGPYALLLTTIFIVLKLCNVVTWSWWWVISPLIINFVIVLGLYLFVIIFSSIISKIGKDDQVEEQYNGNEWRF